MGRGGGGANHSFHTDFSSPQTPTMVPPRFFSPRTNFSQATTPPPPPPMGGMSFVQAFIRPNIPSATPPPPAAGLDWDEMEEHFEAEDRKHRENRSSDDSEDSEDRKRRRKPAAGWPSLVLENFVKCNFQNIIIYLWLGLDPNSNYAAVFFVFRYQAARGFFLPPQYSTKLL